MNSPNRNCMSLTDGTLVNLFSPNLTEVSIEQIAAGLSKICRFNGQCGPEDSIYSVAQHCVLVSEQCEPQHALWGLLHDAWEAFWGDDIRPKKGLLGRTYVAYEMRGDQAVATRFGLPFPIPQAVRAVDDRMCVTEHRDLRQGPLCWHDAFEPPEPYPWRITAWDIATARWRFLDRYYALTETAR